MIHCTCCDKPIDRKVFCSNRCKMEYRYKNKKTPATITVKELKQAVTDLKKNIVKPIKGNYTITKNTLKKANKINTSIQSQLCKHGATIGLCRFNCKLPIDTISVK